MKKFLHSQSGIAMVLVGFSAAVYCIHFMIFRDLHSIVFYLILDIAFLFLNVLLVMIVVQRLLEAREREAVKRKLNMVIGLFFSETGTGMLRRITSFDPESSYLGSQLVVGKEWTDAEFERVRREVLARKFNLAAKRGNLKELGEYLTGSRVFLLGILENPSLLEHESFTNMLWAVYHLSDELSHRKNFSRLPEPDVNHLMVDLARAYQALVLQWLEYMKHLKADYPYLFSFAMRTNPFDEDAAVEIPK